jgi:hypothetical protein
MPGALTQDPTSVAMTPERCSQQTVSIGVFPAQAAICTGLPDHACGVCGQPFNRSQGFMAQAEAKADGLR